ncbi:hypothetical protein LAU42_08810 [Macrococcus armenti]|uniref:hypothetical protein n=1 Tax=Macrococcus armenti TaxID=2875764 RepID=UPI001CCDFC08|nr:hypothetical protein [Macrococcus armenti]UBH21866.1 hypothetical protein LAU42_08810 [Macrococcus armenti]
MNEHQINYETTSKLLAEKVAKLEYENAIYVSVIDDLQRQLSEDNGKDELNLLGGDK